MAYKNNETKSIEYTPFFIGTVPKEGGGVEKFWTGLAKDHVSGRLTNSKLMSMTDEQLQDISFTKDGQTATGEMYTAPDDKDTAEKHGLEKGQDYFSAHRAIIVLQYRKAKREHDKRTDPDYYLKNLIPQPEIQEGYEETVGSMLRKAMKTEEKVVEPEWCDSHHCFAIDCEEHHGTPEVED